MRVFYLLLLLTHIPLAGSYFLHPVYSLIAPFTGRIRQAPQTDANYLACLVLRSHYRSDGVPDDQTVLLLWVEVAERDYLFIRERTDHQSA